MGFISVPAAPRVLLTFKFLHRTCVSCVSCVALHARQAKVCSCTAGRHHVRRAQAPPITHCFQLSCPDIEVNPPDAMHIAIVCMGTGTAGEACSTGCLPWHTGRSCIPLHWHPGSFRSRLAFVKVFKLWHPPLWPVSKPLNRQLWRCSSGNFTAKYSDRTLCADFVSCPPKFLLV